MTMTGENDFFSFSPFFVCIIHNLIVTLTYKSKILRHGNKKNVILFVFLMI